MSSTTPAKPKTTDAQEQSDTPQTQHEKVVEALDRQSSDPPLPLPLPEPSHGGTITSIDISTGGNTVKLDHMGPLVVNKDGSLSRISNWSEMSEIERQNTVRILGKRNLLRREALKGEEEVRK